MYTPPHFAVTDRSRLLHLIAAHPLASLVQSTKAGLSANVIPLYWVDDGSELGVLRGHVARKNPLWQEADSAILALFQAGDGYVSPSFYPSKASDPRVVPTWNYALVQIKGALRAIDDAAEVCAIVSHMTARHEAGRDRPWHIDEAPADFMQKMLAAIVGIEIKIEQISGKFKLSQNQSAENQAGIAAQLAAPWARGVIDANQ
ncbi:FMN-binding negative transcriptional regulator [Deefgea salmonis]|uniref:FMN-binding negative transcriptional regulator n=1 Tax=Deefgea salmonis TaxID=2875502 RepID=A0ABS8BM44_9NEIS|nr:FMN-binding negative transcriptional regulator [Deefgea salmonis]MCB5196797.1 FMN-binding negative transcriptional regulator [Deefgea salmonis]